MHPCPYCQYNLEGLPGVDRCPECGNIVSANYLESLMQHRFIKEEQTLYKIALAGWGAHLAPLVLLLMADPTMIVVVLLACIPITIMLAMTMVLAKRSRKSWPRRYAIAKDGIQGAAPRGTFWALSSWALPSIFFCGFLSSL